MSIFTSKEDMPLSGTSSPFHKESISDSFFSSATGSSFRNSVGTDQSQGSSGSLDELLNFDFQALNFLQKDFPPDRSTVEQVCPQNLGPARHLTKKRQEISKIAPTVPIRSEDQEFSDSDESSQGYQWTLRNKNLSGSNNFQSGPKLKSDQIQGSSGSLDEPLNFDFQALNYIQKDFTPDRSTIEQVCPQNLRPASEHVRHLTKIHQEISKIAPTVPIRSKDQEFSDSDESSQSYQCNFRSKNLSGSNNLRSGSEQKLSKPNRFLNSDAASSSVINHEPKNIGPVSNNKAVFQAMLGQLRDQDKGIGYHISRKLKGDISNFTPSYERDRLFFTCNVCDLHLRPDKVVSHAHSQAHLNFSKRSLFHTKPEATPQNGDSVESSEVLSSPTESDQIFYELAKDLNKADRRIVEGFGHDSVNILNHFQPSSENKERLSFICKVCQLSLYPKYVKSHLFSCTDVKDLRKNHSLVSLEDLNGTNRNIVKKVMMDVNYKLFVFQLFCENRSNELGFFCNVCHVAVMPVHVKDHINSNAHSENLFTNPFSLEFKSLNRFNKRIVKDLTDVIEGGMKDFSLLYKTGTEELRFFCKICRIFLWPDKVEGHFKLSTHLNPASVKNNDNRKVSGKLNSKQQFSNHDTPNCKTLSSPTRSSIPDSQPQNWTVVSFDSLTNSQKEVVEKLTLQSKIESDCIDFLRGVGPDEFYIVCKFCYVTFKPTLLPGHVESSDHLNNSKLIAIFYNFVSLEETRKNVLRNLHNTLGSKLNAFSLIGTKDPSPKFKCKSCEVAVALDTVNVDWFANHSDCKKQPVMPIKRTSDKPAAKLFSQSNHEAAIHKTREVRNLSCGSDGIHSSFATSSLQTPLKEPSTEHKISENNPSCKTKSITSFNCQDCNATINFDAEKYNGLRESNAESLFTNCCGKSAKTILLSCEVSKSNTSEAATAVPSDVLNNSGESKSGEFSLSDEATRKMLIDRDFDFILSNAPLASRFRLKCKLCRTFVPPEDVIIHVNSEAHIKYSLRGSVTNTGFECFNDRNEYYFSLDSDEDTDKGTEAVAIGSSQNQWEKITKSEILDRSYESYGSASPSRSRRNSDKDTCSLM